MAWCTKFTCTLAYMKVSDLTVDTLRDAVAGVVNKTHLEQRLFGSSRQGRANELVARVEVEKLDTSHWTGRYVSRPKPYRLSLAETKKSNIRKRVLGEGLLEEKCVECGSLPEWRGKPMALHLDHKNGNSNDHRLENLRFLCPNCHQQTETWGPARLKKVPRDEILRELAKTKTRVEIAAMYGVHDSTVSHRLRRYNK